MPNANTLRRRRKLPYTFRGWVITVLYWLGLTHDRRWARTGRPWGVLSHFTYVRWLKRRVETLERHNQRLRELATRDTLTGLWTRRHVEGIFDGWCQTPREDRRSVSAFPLSALYVDIDHFKALNDAHGHDAGDRVLAAVGGELRSQARRDDLVARWGGEEFVVLLPRTSPEEALQAAQRARQAVKAHGVSISVGAAHAAAPSHAADILARADAALYRAKAAGRDRVVEESSKALPLLRRSA